MSVLNWNLERCLWDTPSDLRRRRCELADLQAAASLAKATVFLRILNMGDGLFL